jgi:acetamidase/formamidase
MRSSRKVSVFALLFAVSSIGTGAKSQTAPEKPAAKSSAGKQYTLPANKDTVQWGWFDPTEKPKLVVESGDTVSIETLRHRMDAETSTNWIFMGFDEDLNEAMKIAVRETVNFLAEQKMVPMSRDEAYALTSIVGDCRVSQVVDIRKGVHCMIPKSIFVKK